MAGTLAQWTEKHCPECGGALLHDKWEDCALCAKCDRMWYPSDFGLSDDHDAGVWAMAWPKDGA